MTVEVPIILSPYFEDTPELSGQVFQFRKRWSTRGEGSIGSWYLDIKDVISGIKIVNGIDLFAPYKYMDGLPIGKLGASRNTGTVSKPKFNNFGIGQEITLIYEP
ncbi:hypothetical protein KAR91_65955 [Candidatus Pacearchaeota archaeon]|nr:hypothetical protein [Candidatus Pacearchaeota archaeon]